MVGLRRVGRKGGTQQVKICANGKISLSPADLPSKLPPIRTITDEGDIRHNQVQCYCEPYFDFDLNKPPVTSKGKVNITGY